MFTNWIIVLIFLLSLLVINSANDFKYDVIKTDLYHSMTDSFCRFTIHMSNVYIKIQYPVFHTSFLMKSPLFSTHIFDSHLCFKTLHIICKNITYFHYTKFPTYRTTLSDLNFVTLVLWLGICDQDFVTWSLWPRLCNLEFVTSIWWPRVCG